MYLDTTSKVLEIILGGAITTNQLEWTADYIDTQSGNTFAPANAIGVTNSATLVTMVAAPAASTQRKISALTVYNADTVAATVTVRIYDGTNRRRVISQSIASGSTLVYTPEGGWTVFPSSGSSSVVGANPTATASDTAVNGSATTFMRSDAAPAIQKATNAVFGLGKGDGFSIQAVAGLIGTKFSGLGVGLATAQAVTDGVTTVCLFDTVNVDTQGGYVIGTGVYTPNKAGNYLVIFSAGMSLNPAGTLAYAYADIYKNAVRVSEDFVAGLGSGSGVAYASPGMTCAVIAVMNGTTDTLSFKGTCHGTGGSNQFAGSNACVAVVIYLGA